MTMAERSHHDGLAASLDRLAALDPYLATGLLAAPEAGWSRAGDLLAAPGAWLDAALEQIMAQYGVPDRKSAAAFLVGSYAWYVGAAAIGCYLADRRVPSLAPDLVAVQVAGARVQVALLDSGFAALPDDPAAGAPGVEPAADAEALRGLLRSRIEEHMAALIEVVAAHTRLGQRAQWNLVADACAALFLHVGGHLGDTELACAEGLAVVKASGSPMRPSKTGYLTVTEGDRCQTFRMRGGCCLYYKTPKGENCATCPLIPQPEREARLRASLTATA
ncbi:MAG TPA: ferric iron reductase [Herpetosiphonaceae bacterium]|nr:ferric iron reductase [Herpetosiphonaceae bacterium]